MSGMILPAVHPTFEWQTTETGPALICRPLALHARHLFTTRSWTLGSRSPAMNEDERWAEVASAMDVDLDRLVRMRQVHGADAIEALPGMPLQPADIVVGDNPDLALAVQAADCVPLLIVDVHTGAAAAAHAGWRGLAARVPERTVNALGRAYGSRPENLIAAVGPSIGACCYEVGADVRRAFAAAGFGPLIDRWFLEERPVVDGNPPLPSLPERADGHHWFFDGWQSVADQLEASGISRERFFSPRLCTASHPHLLCSYRRDGAPAGRLAGVVRPALRS